MCVTRSDNLPWVLDDLILQNGLNLANVIKLKKLSSSLDERSARVLNMSLLLIIYSVANISHVENCDNNLHYLINLILCEANLAHALYGQIVLGSIINSVNSVCT